MSTEKTTNELKNLIDEFDLLLKKELGNQFPYLEDNGFSNRVIGKINPKKTVTVRLIAKLPLLISALIALVVFSYFPWLEIVIDSYAFLLTINMIDILLFSLVFFVGNIIALSYWSISTKQ